MRGYIQRAGLVRESPPVCSIYERPDPLPPESAGTHR
jgi:hypothetical protein